MVLVVVAVVVSVVSLQHVQYIKQSYACSMFAYVRVRTHVHRWQANLVMDVSTREPNQKEGNLIGNKRTEGTTRTSDR